MLKKDGVVNLHDLLEKDDVKKLYNLCELFAIVKESVIYADQVNGEDVPSIYAINELRHAFDHLMRIHAFQLGLNKVGEGEKKVNSQEYVKKNFDKSYSHIYRAGYDALDMTCLTLKDKIADIMNNYSIDTINAVFSSYYKKIKIDLVALDEEIAKARNTKDVGNPLHEKFMNYIELSKRLKDHYISIMRKIPLMDDYERKLRQKENRQIFVGGVSIGVKTVVVAVVTAIIAVVTGTIGFLFGLRG